MSLKKAVVVVSLGLIVAGGWVILRGKTNFLEQQIVKNIIKMPVQSGSRQDNLLMAKVDFSGRGMNSALKSQADDYLQGNPEAPIHMVIYTSMTCGHCAKYHNEVYPKIKKNYIDTGKISYIMRDMPLDSMSLGMAMVYRCNLEQSQHQMLVDAFMKTQDKWIRSKEPLEEIKKIARMAGMTGEAVEACTKNEDVYKKIMKMRKIASEDLRIEGTPVIFINGEEVKNYFLSTIIKALKEAQKQTQPKAANS